MKKFLAVLGSLTFAMPLYASVTAPVDQRNVSLNTIDFVGSLACAVTAATGTTAVECTTGRGTVYGVVITSSIVGAEVVMRDSGTANTTSSSFTAVGNYGTGSNSTGNGTTQMLTFPRPVQFTNGLSVNLSNAPQQGEIWTILYRPLKATE